MGFGRGKLLRAMAKHGTASGTSRLQQQEHHCSAHRVMRKSVLWAQQWAADLLDAFKGRIVVAERAKGIRHAIRPRQGAQQQLKAIQWTGQTLVQLDSCTLHGSSNI